MRGVAYCVKAAGFQPADGVRFSPSVQMEGRKAGVLIGFENRDVVIDVGVRSPHPPQ